MSRSEVTFSVLKKLGKYIPRKKLFFIQQRMETMSEEELQRLYVAVSGFKSPLVALLISIFFGGLAIDRFYLGEAALGVIKLLTCGVCSVLGVWIIVDWIIIYNHTRKVNWKRFLLYFGYNFV